MIPDLKVGVAVLTNQESAGAFDSIAFHIVDHYLGAPAFDWIAGYHAVEARELAAAASGGSQGREARGMTGVEARRCALGDLRGHVSRCVVRRHHHRCGRAAGW